MKKYLIIPLLAAVCFAQFTMSNLKLTTFYGSVTIPLTGGGNVAWSGQPDKSCREFLDQIQLNLATPAATDDKAADDFNTIKSDLQAYGSPQNGTDEANAIRLVACLKKFFGGAQ